MRRTPSFPLFLASASLGAVLTISAAGADTVGTAGAVNTTSSGTPPGAPTRVIEIGTQLVENEKIQTTGTGSVQVLFIDKTTLNVGPNSSLVIDRFVYNPATTKGELALSLGKGVLRVVGGVATHSEGATIRTPVAAIGLRGGIAIISHSGAKGTDAILGFGKMSVTTLCGGSANCQATTVSVTRPGFGVTVAGLNQPPSSPARVSSQALAQANGQLSSKGGQSGGTSQQPTDNLARTYNVGTPSSPGAPMLNTASAGRATVLTVARATQQTVQQGSQNAAATQTGIQVAFQTLIKALTSVKPPPIVPPPIVPPPIVPPPIVPPPIIPPPVLPVAAPTATYAMVTPGPFSTGADTSPVPYLTGAFAGTGGFTVSPILGYQRGGFNADGVTPDTTSRQFQAGLSVTGKGVNQNATLFVMTSEISNAPNIGFTHAGGFQGVTVRNPDAWYGLAGGAVSSATPTSLPNTVRTVNGTPVAGFAINNTNANLNTGIVSNSQSSNFVSSGLANYTFNPINTGTPTTSANNHPSSFLNGYVGGMMVTATSAGYTKPYIVTNVSGSPGDVGIYLPGDSSEMLAFFNVGSNVGATRAPKDGLTSSTYLFGGLDVAGVSVSGLNTARGTYVSPSNFAARAAAIFNDGADTPLSTRDDMSLSEPGGYANQQMVTAESVGANTSSFLTSISSVPVTPCACESTQWGFWSAYNGKKDSGGNLVFEDQGNLLLWVAGVPTSIANIPTTGTATYTGHAIANIANPNNITTYLAAGTFSAVANFGTRTGAVTINGLDGTNYTGTAMQAGSTANFNGTLTGTTAGRMATLAGSFFQGGPTATVPAGEVGGSLVLRGTGGYLGSGIFLGRKP